MKTETDNKKKKIVRIVIYKDNQRMAIYYDKKAKTYKNE